MEAANHLAAGNNAVLDPGPLVPTVAKNRSPCHCMVYCQGIPAHTGGGKIINRPVVAQFNSVTELSLVQGES